MVKPGPRLLNPAFKIRGSAQIEAIQKGPRIKRSQTFNVIRLERCLKIADVTSQLAAKFYKRATGYPGGARLAPDAIYGLRQCVTTLLLPNIRP
jgi:hypothetical protein